MSVKFRKNIFGRWILVNPANDREAWSGARFVPIDHLGMPAGAVQVCNFETRDKAKDYARERALL